MIGGHTEGKNSNVYRGVPRGPLPKALPRPGHVPPLGRFFPDSSPGAVRAKEAD